MSSNNTITPMSIIKVQTYCYAADDSDKFIPDIILTKDTIMRIVLSQIVGFIDDTNTIILSSGKEVIVSEVDYTDIVDKFNLVF